ncbi:glucosyltransferase domain-containing protein [Variovorax sp. LT1P1]|uniref:glucosyltransferase domain-containing protein n=1 Tax=Variovorax sp. LT1P1 TaxID=3443730 RepID=UPI003F47D0EB
MNSLKGVELVFWDRRSVRLLLIVFAIAVLSKGEVLSRGFAVDDYVFAQGLKQSDFNFLLTQGRFLLGGFARLIDSLGANLSDLYFSFGFLALLLQSALVVAILRFVGVVNSPAAVLAGPLMVAHPYLAEILTFRMVLPGYCIAAALSILAFEMAADCRSDARRYLTSFLAVSGMLLIYQGFLNYLAAAIAFCFLFGAFERARIGRNAASAAEHYRRAFALSVICVASAAFFLLAIYILKRLGVMEPTGRANFIGWKEVPLRLELIGELLARVYWKGEPIFPRWLKAIALLGIFASGICALYVFSKSVISRQDGFKSALALLLSILLLIPVTVGVIAPFKEWWPVPRVLPQVPVIYGLLLVFLYPGVIEIAKIVGSNLSTKAFFVVAVVLVASFVVINNQIFADQKRLNAWDGFEANRVVARIERLTGFKSDSQPIYVGGGSWRHSATLNTIQGDMNISAFAPENSKVPLLIEVSGYNFKSASGDEIVAGREHCARARAWPHEESISAINGLVVVCLPQ